ncbi:IPT/TIG domain-containing protein [bacterium A37T11]|nr:IPT/TIG domain-containing protein [bacterium A37T11]
MAPIHKKINIIAYLSVMVYLFTLAVQCSKKEDTIPKPSLQIKNYYPNSGKAGTLITILGEGFSADVSANIVSFGGTPAEVLGAKSTELVVRAPEGGSTGAISLSTDGNKIDVGPYTYQTLSVQGISPFRAQVGAHLTIHGEGFSSLEGPAKVMVNGTDAEVVNATDTLLVVEVPRTGSGVGAVAVTVDNMEAEGPQFSYMAVRVVKPLSGGAKTRVTIQGEGFDDLVAGNVVTFNGKPASIVEAAADRLVVLAPDAVQTGPVIVTVGNDPIIGPEFIVVPPPSIDFVTPLSGPAGTEMIIRGKTFSPEPMETYVRINGKEIVPASVAANEIKLTLPGNTGSGKIEVIVNDQAVEGPDFRDQNLGISAVAPADGMAGTEVVISGTGFSNNAAENIISFNGITAQVVSASESSLTVKAPASLSTGRISVSAYNQQAVSPVDFVRAGVLTVAGPASGLQISPSGGSIAVDNSGNIYVTEIQNNRIMKISPGGQVSRFAGSQAGSEGLRDGIGDAALFRLSADAGLVFDDQQRLYVTDARNQAVRRISPGGEVTTLVNNVGIPIGKPAIHANGDIYIPGYNNAMVVLKPSSGTFTQLSGGSAGSSTVRAAITPTVNSAGYGDVYDVHDIVNSGNRSRIFKRTGLGVPFGLASINFAGGTSAGYLDDGGNYALFNQIRGVALQGQNLLALDAGNFALRKVSLTETVLAGPLQQSSPVVSTIMKAAEGFEDGDFRTAKFSSGMWDFVLSSDGNTVYILDCGNNAIRKILLR